MNYPIWETLVIGGPSLIALIAVVHVYISHLAVGGGLFIWLTDLKGVKENNPAITEYVRKHTWFFLLLTMVFGGLTGVGIWFIIALVHPAGTSELIHNFVFGWAIEWVFFIGEIAALLLYHYRFDKLKPKHRLNLAFLYFVFAWLSLFIINGIIAFMLTPGKWIKTGNFWDGFFNPTYFPSLLFRSFIAFMLAGLFGYVTVVFMKDSRFRITMMRYCSKWLLLPTVGIVATGIYYFYAVPADIRHATLVLNPESGTFVTVLVVCSIIIFLGGILLSLRTGRGVQKAITFVLLLIGLGWMGGFEYLREIARKPYVINDYMYSSGIFKKESAALAEKGVLANAKWTAVRKITTETRMQAGNELFNILCLRCHTVGGIRNDIVPRAGRFSLLGMKSLLTGMGKINTYMPPFPGTSLEKEVLAEYIVGRLNGKELTALPAVGEGMSLPEPEVPAFDMEKDEYVLLAWSDGGMHCVSDCDRWFSILPPGNTVEAQLIRRGEIPEIVTEGVELSFSVEKGFENPSDTVRFWDFAEIIYGVKLEKNTGFDGLGVTGKLVLNEGGSGFIASKVPVVPYSSDGEYNPYPLMEIEARDKENGNVLARTKTVSPVSTEVGCRNCHAGEWRWNNKAGISDETAVNILVTHDRMSRTGLHREALNGNPKSCQECHADPAVSSRGNPDLLNFSTAIHGLHAIYMPVKGAGACALCHPAHSGGNTRCERGVHKRLGLTCIDCHGQLSEHAASLLYSQKEKNGAKRLLKLITSAPGFAGKEIMPRGPWANEPDCLNCHVDFEKPEAGASGFNAWTPGAGELFKMRTGEEGSIRCSSCHSAPHAIYPAFNPFSKNRDVIQPVQYSKTPYPIGSNRSCKVCHTIDMEESIHHSNMDRPFRNIMK